MVKNEFTPLNQSPVLFKHHGDDVYLFTLKNTKGVRIEISNLGTIIRSFLVPSKSGELVDIVLGLDNISDYLEEEYVKTKTYLGAVIGRYANRIANSSFQIEGVDYTVSANIPPHQLHGGIEGFDKKVWKIVSIESSPNPKIVFSYLSIDGEEGFPGNLNVKQSFELTGESELIICTEATTDKSSPVNLTHHDYFNLDGNGQAYFHRVEINSDQYLGQKPDYVPSGDILGVQDTRFDFRRLKQVKSDLTDTEGYDQSFVINKEYGTWGLAATCYSEKTGIKLEVFTDEPTIHFYTGKYLNIPGKNGSFYTPFTGLCFETQHHTNAVNIDKFPSTILKPGKIYSHRTSYKVGLI